MKRTTLREIFIACAGAVLAVVIIAVIVGGIAGIKKMITPSDPQPTKEGIFALEVSAFFVLLAAFVLGEGLRVLQALQRWWTGQSMSHVGLSWGDLALVLVLLDGSLLIYLGFIKLLALS